MVLYWAMFFLLLSTTKMSARRLEQGRNPWINELYLPTNGCQLPDGHWYEVGTTKIIKCLQCICLAREQQSCTYICPGCKYKYKNYPVGETFRDDCRVCMCQGRDHVVCSDVECRH